MSLGLLIAGCIPSRTADNLYLVRGITLDPWIAFGLFMVLSSALGLSHCVFHPSYPFTVCSLLGLNRVNPLIDLFNLHPETNRDRLLANSRHVLSGQPIWLFGQTRSEHNRQCIDDAAHRIDLHLDSQLAVPPLKFQLVGQLHGHRHFPWYHSPRCAAAEAFWRTGV